MAMFRRVVPVVLSKRNFPFQVSAFHLGLTNRNDVSSTKSDGPTVAVIGAGLAGVNAIKCALDEGLHPTCFEQDDQIGGTWYYTDHKRPNQGAAAYKELVSNDGKELMAFTDFPMPKKNEMNMPWQQYLKYLQDYAQHFDLKRCIQFNTRVTKVTPAADYSDTGRWKVYTQKNNSSQTNVQEFDKVMVATGPFRSAVMPDIPGMENFKGEMIHVKDYRQQSIFQGKRVLFVGGAIFAAEIATLSATVAKQTYIAVKSDGGFFLFPKRTQVGNCAFGMALPRNVMIDKEWEENIPAFKEMALNYLDTDKYDLSPKKPLLRGGRLAVANDLADQIREGEVIPKRGLTRFTENGAVLEDGSEINDIDLVVFATGFDMDLDFIDVPGIKGVRQRQDVNLYLWMFPTDLPHHSLALIDFGTWYMTFALMSELQNRLATRVFTGRHQLPPKSVMKEWAEKQRQYFKEKTDGKFMLLPLVTAEEVAEELGVLPSFWKLFWKNPIMAHKVHYGPNLPIVYRLVGPGAHKSAWKEYDNWYRRGYEDSIPPPMPWGLHHKALASLLLVGVFSTTGFVFMQ